VNLADFQALTFDCYGTLIDWEKGILAELEPWLARAGRPAEPDDILEAYAEAELSREREDPAALYPEILKRTFKDLGKRFGVSEDEAEAVRFSTSVARWPAFRDSPAALAELKKRFKLIIISNVDRASFAASAEKLGVEFDAVFTAEEIGSYKPDPRNFDFLLDRIDEMGVPRDKVLHTAQSMTHDILPAKSVGLKTAWIHRRFAKGGWGATAAPGKTVEPEFLFTSLAAMAAAV
jgi:2-haloalkanoic acid dehalogenase type II